MTVTIKEIEHDTIALQDGTRLAYRAWIPADAESTPVPAVLEYLPYRKGDGTVVRDDITMPATARHGYACIRFDIRGSGESSGLFDDEYSEQELSDGEEIIEWLCAQPWCDGNVGVVGISWGGFNGLQLAYRQVPGLKGVISICSADDRFNQDIHFAGGCLLNDNLDWAGFFWAYALCRMPDPKFVGDDWQDVWVSRLENLPFLPRRWLSEQSKSDYWKHGSVSEDYARIEIPIYAIGGWADSYRNTIFRLLENLQSPCKGLIGPWGHKYPHIALPEPKIDYVRESVRWWDYCLKGKDNGIIDEPALQYYLLDSARPQEDYTAREGVWQAESEWPSASIVQQTLYLSDRSLTAQRVTGSETQSICSPEDTGLAAGKYMVGVGVSGEHPADQSGDDAGSLTFDTDPLDDALSIVGLPAVSLTIRSDRPGANLAVRLCDLHPDGEVTLITYGVLNLAHRNSNEEPEPLVPGQAYDVTVGLNSIAYRLSSGHRLRLSVSTAYWPLIWPSPEKVTLDLNLGSCELRLPTKAVVSDYEHPALLPFEQTDSGNHQTRREPMTEKKIDKDDATGWTTLTIDTDFGHVYHPGSDTEIDFRMQQEYRIQVDDPNSAQYKSSHHVSMIKRGIPTTVKSEYTLTSSPTEFHVQANWHAELDGARVFNKDFDEAISRKLV